MANIYAERRPVRCLRGEKGAFYWLRGRRLLNKPSWSSGVSGPRKGEINLSDPSQASDR